jgi:RND family efflux transporter MFP subunit
MPFFKWIKRRAKFVFTITIIVLVGFLIYRKTIAKQSINQETTTAQIRDLKQVLDVTGKVEARGQAVLHFQTGGKLIYIGAKVGDNIKKGQVIASLDKTALKKSIQKSLNTFLTNRTDFEQYRLDHKVTSDDFNSQLLTPEIIKKLEKDQFSLQNAALDVEIQDLTMQLATITSPINGIVTQMATEVAPVNIGVTDTFTIIDPGSLYFAAMIDEADLSKVYASQSAELILDAYPDKPINTQVSSIDFTSSVGESGGTVYKIKLPLPSNQLDYRLGLNGQVNLLLNERIGALSLPIETIITKDSQKFVKVLESGNQISKPVKTGIETADYVEVLEGITPNDQVVIPK